MDWTDWTDRDRNLENQKQAVSLSRAGHTGQPPSMQHHMTLANQFSNLDGPQ